MLQPFDSEVYGAQQIISPNDEEGDNELHDREDLDLVLQPGTPGPVHREQGLQGRQEDGASAWNTSH